MNREKSAPPGALDQTDSDPIEEGGYRFVLGFYFIAFAAAFLFCLLSLLGSFWR
jgi:hypothetical protein